MVEVGGKELIEPVVKYGVKLLSIGFFVDPDSATVWRGPMASNALKQMVEGGFWDELDFMLIDLPPGTRVGYSLDFGTNCRFEWCNRG